AHNVRPRPVSSVTGKWQACTPQSVPNFSAIGYFFGRELHKKLDVPIGLINSSWGGTVAEAWASRKKLQSVESLKYMLQGFDAQLKLFDAAEEKYVTALTDYLGRAKTERAAGNALSPPPPVPEHPFPQSNPNVPTVLYN